MVISYHIVRPPVDRSIRLTLNRHCKSENTNGYARSALVEVRFNTRPLVYSCAITPIVNYPKNNARVFSSYSRGFFFQALDFDRQESAQSNRYPIASKKGFFFNYYYYCTNGGFEI